MIARRFQSFQRLVLGTAAVMGLYIVTSQVAAERTALERVDRQILSARKDIRQLQTELGTRGSLRQLERWNGEVLALTTPDADQFLPSERALAGLDRTGVTPGPRYAPAAMVLAMTAHAPDAAPVASDAVERPAADSEKRALAKEARKPEIRLASAEPVKKPAERKEKKAAPKKPIDLLELKLLDDGLVGELASRARAESGARQR
jgi:hypothetical protein